MAADLLYWHKSYVRERFVLELTIWVVDKSHHYLEGYKYRLICLDNVSGKRILFDNHSPKGHHMHIDEKQFPYDFTNEQNLLKDFKNRVLEHLGVKI